MAAHIEKKTGVAKTWLLSNPSPNEIPIDIEGNPWIPEKFLDPLYPSEHMPNFRKLMQENPASLPRIIGEMVRTQLTEEMEQGKTDFLESIVEMINQNPFYSSAAMEPLREQQRKIIADAIMEKVWPSKPNPTPPSPP